MYYAPSLHGLVGLVGLLAVTACLGPEEMAVEHAFCPALAQPETYADGLASYRNLAPGQAGRIFRTETDFHMPYAPSVHAQEKLLELQNAFLARNIDLVLVFPPVRGLVHAGDILPTENARYQPYIQAGWEQYEKMIADLRQRGLHIVGLSRHELPAAEFYYKRDHHWSSAGARAMAEKTAAYIKTLPSYAKIPRIHHVTEEAPSVSFEGSFNKAFVHACNTHLPPEEATVWRTSPAENMSSADRLFGDMPAPRIALLGTSNSVNDSAHANFDGFLKQALSADVQNMAYAGAGLGTSLFSLLDSSLLADDSIRIAVWEIPGYYDFDEIASGVLAEAIPAVFGDCEDDAILNADMKRGKDAWQTLVEEPELKGLGTKQRHYVRLAFSAPVSGPISLRFHNQDHSTFRRKMDVYNSGRFFHLQIPAADNLEKITLDAPASATGLDMKFQLCPLPLELKV